MNPLSHRRGLLLAAFVFTLGPCGALAKDAQTAAPPDVQEDITGFLGMIARSQHQCSRIGKPKVVSSELSSDAMVSSEGTLTNGSIVEEWHVRMCGPKVKYRFTIAPDSKGKLSLKGFEPLR